MCFYHDYDWYASVTTESHEPAKEEFRCGECGRTMPVGAMRHDLFMQEREECICMDEAEAEGCKCETPDYGESFATDRCDDCNKFLQAIEAAEIAEGCRADEARPALECMIAELHEFEAEHREKYFAKALEMFPELTGFVEWMRGKFKQPAY